MILAWEPSLALIAGACALGILLAIAEVFLPSGGALTILSVASFIAAVVMGFMMGTGEGVVTLIIVVVLAPVVLYLAVRIWPHTPLAKKLILSGPSAVAKAGDLAKLDPDELVGKIGVARTQLRPSGKIVIGDRPIDCVTEGELVDKGEKVRIIAVHGARVVVRRVDGGANA